SFRIARDASNATACRRISSWSTKFRRRLPRSRSSACCCRRSIPRPPTCSPGRQGSGPVGGLHSDQENPVDEIYVIGVGMTQFGRLPDMSIKAMSESATQAALADAGIDRSEIQAAYFANASQGHMEGQHMIRGQIALRSMGIDRIPVVNVENACAGGSTAFNLAVTFLKAGEGDVALAVGADKMVS